MTPDPVPAPAGEAPDLKARALEVVRMNRAFRGAPLDAPPEVLETLPDKAEWEAAFDALEVAALVSRAPGEVPDLIARLHSKIAEWHTLAAQIREDANTEIFEERYRLESKAAQVEACALDLEAALGASGAPGRDAPSEPSGAAIEAAYAVSERREGEPRTEPLVRALRAAYAVDFGASRGLPAAPPLRYQDDVLCDGCGETRRCIIAESDDEAPYQICRACVREATRA